MITKPMLACVCKDINKLDFVNNMYLATPKLDGIRALKINGKLVSRTFKPIKNTYIRTILEKILPDGADGEIIVGDTFQETSSAVMREAGEPEFIFYWFDYVKFGLETQYHVRMFDLSIKYSELESQDNVKRLHMLLPVTVESLKELQEYEQECIDKGYEGIIIRRGDSPYKCGRATPNSEWLLKIKRFQDDEAKILGFGEKMHNNNPAKKDNFGRTERSSHKENKIPANTLGCLHVKDLKTGIKFEIGTGFNDELRKEIWNNQEDYIGLTCKYKHFAVSGVKDKPRFPVYLGIRDEEDM